ncbi:MAG: dihydrolipoyl dehydrogenase, partial [Deltaproteobacteria bacterium]
DGLLAAQSIAGEKSFKDYKTVPWAVFCEPEIAVAGLTEKEAADKGFKVKVGRFPFAASGKALAMNDSDGMAKVVIDEKTEAILGVHIVGPEASNLIAEAALAIEMGATVEDLVRTIHTHPTLPEVMPEAVEAAFYKAIHIYKPKRG